MTSNAFRVAIYFAYSFQVCNKRLKAGYIQRSSQSPTSSLCTWPKLIQPIRPSSCQPHPLGPPLPTQPPQNSPEHPCQHDRPGQAKQTHPPHATVKPHPVLPASCATSGPEHWPAPSRPAQHALAQSALLKHWPVMNCEPSRLPTFCEPARSGLIVPALDPAAAAAAPPDDAEEDEAAFTTATPADDDDDDDDVAFAAPDRVKPHPVFPFALPTSTPEHTAAPSRPAQQPDAQSALLKHWPVMNCDPSALPTFCEPGRDVLIVPAVELPPAAAAAVAVEVPAGGAAAATATAEDVAGAAAVPVPVPVPPKPHPVLPAWNCAPRPEQMPAPLSVAQQADAQSACERQAPPINWVPLPLPMFLAPAGSGERGAGFGFGFGFGRGLARAGRRTIVVTLVSHGWRRSLTHSEGMWWAVKGERVLTGEQNGDRLWLEHGGDGGDLGWMVVTLGGWWAALRDSES
jgi:hypothetical protein